MAQNEHGKQDTQQDRGSAALQQAQQMMEVSRAFFTLARVLDKQTEDVAGSQAQTWLMICLANGEDHTLKALSQRLRVSPPSLCLMLKRLTAQGLVERLSHPTDKRRAMYEITQAGRQWLDTLKQQRVGCLAKMLDALPAQRREALAEQLAQISEDLKMILAQQGCE